ncbi:hypothetical protein EDC01DRAFT_777482 [Geopyxis carbonaria]|nr:hypothetical protein EDC01DRAFT_777482 [Geopyxis carbonaria]
MNASSAAPGHFPALSLSPSSTAGVVAPPPKRPRGRPRKNTLPGTVSAPTTVRKPAAKPRTAPATTVKRTPAAARKQTTTTGNTPTTWRKRSTAPDASFRTDTRHITHTSIPTDAPRQKRLSALGAGLRGYRNDGLSDLDNALEEMERQKNKSKKVKKVLVKKVEVAPGRWAEVEISDDSDEEMLSGDAQDMRKNDVEEEAGKEEEEAQAGTEEVGEMMMADMIDIDKDMDEEFGARWQRRRTAGWW